MWEAGGAAGRTKSRGRRALEPRPVQPMHSTLGFNRREHCGLCGRFQRLRRDLANKAIPSPAQSFNKARFLWAVVERATDLPYRSIQALIEIDEYIGRPKLRL